MHRKVSTNTSPSRQTLQLATLQEAVPLQLKMVSLVSLSPRCELGEVVSRIGYPDTVLERGAAGSLDG